MPPRARDRVRMCPSTRINETDRMACVAVRFHVPVRKPAVSDCSAGFDPFTKNSH
jgi:hypothetical protein